jgi:putative methyltransferase (TIGR04325 family)
VVTATGLASSGAVAFERDGITFDQPETRWPVAAGLLLASSRNHGRLRVLDFGGSLGSVYWQHRRLLEHIDLSWGVVEQEDFIREGARFANGELSFWSSIDDFLTEGAPDLILLSSVLQYLSEPQAILEALSATKAPYLLIDRTPVSDLPQDTISVQRVPEQIYQASYPAWILSQKLLLGSLSQEWSLIEAFSGIEPDMTTSSGVGFTWRGYLFERRPRG